MELSVRMDVSKLRKIYNLQVQLQVHRMKMEVAKHDQRSYLGVDRELDNILKELKKLMD